MIKMGSQRETCPLKRNISIDISYFVNLNKSGLDNLTKSTCRIEKKITTIESKIEKMEMDKQTKEDLKTVALGTSKINYLDPRITVAWCKTHEVPIEKVSQLKDLFLLLVIELIAA
jgi:hypothetical protein